MARYFILIACLFLTNCASREGIYRNYNQIDSYDGLDEKEAKMIAQKKIINTPEQRYYRITAPAISRNTAALEYPEYWFVVFAHNWFSPISTESRKTYRELKEAVYLVVIHKESGFVQFYGEYFPQESDNFDWVFNEGGYRSVLDPIPGIPSIDLEYGRW